MGARSTIDRLPKEIREAIGGLVQSGRTLDEILTHLRKLDVDVSRSALGRHTQKLALVGESLRRSRDLATALATQFGESTSDQVARVNLEMLHTAIFKLQTTEAVDDEGNATGDTIVLDPKDIKALSEALRNAATASATDANRILKLRREAKEEAAKAAGAAATSAGLGKETVDMIRRAVLGANG